MHVADKKAFSVEGEKLALRACFPQDVTPLSKLLLLSLLLVLSLLRLLRVLERVDEVEEEEVDNKLSWEVSEQYSVDHSVGKGELDKSIGGGRKLCDSFSMKGGIQIERELL